MDLGWSELSERRSEIGARFWSYLSSVIVHLLLIAGSAAMAIPFLWMIFSTLKRPFEIKKVPPTFFPQDPSIESYIKVIREIPMGRFYLNSIIVTMSVLFLVLFTSSLAGFIFAKYRFAGRDAIFTILLSTMMVPFQVTMIPLYLVLLRLYLLDTLWALIIPGAFSAFGIFLMKQFIEGVPTELIDAARIDGASDFGIYIRIILPSVGPALAALGIFNFMWVWNDYLWPLIVINTMEKRTLPIALTWFSGKHMQRYDLDMAVAVLVVVPVLTVFLVFQRWIVQGIVLTGFK